MIGRNRRFPARSRGRKSSVLDEPPNTHCRSRSLGLSLIHICKSTLLHMLGGLDRPTNGTVIVDGKDIFSLKDEALTIFRRRKIGFVDVYKRQPL